MTTPIIMDGITYQVRVVYDTMELSFELAEGDNAGKMLDWSNYRDLQGTEYSHQMRVEPDPLHYADFDRFFSAISAPVNSHHVVLPLGQGTIEYDAMVTSGNLVYAGKMGGVQRWKNLIVSYTPIRPQRYPTG